MPPVLLRCYAWISSPFRYEFLAYLTSRTTTLSLTRSTLKRALYIYEIVITNMLIALSIDIEIKFAIDVKKMKIIFFQIRTRDTLLRVGK